MRERGTRRLDRASRLRSSRDYRRLNRSGTRARGAGFIVLGCRNRRMCRNAWRRVRIGITASRRVGNAVVRNRVKRQVREWFRNVEVAGASGYDLVVVAKSGVGEWPTMRIRGELDRLVKSLLKELGDG